MAQDAAKAGDSAFYENLSLELRRGVLVLAVLSQLRHEQYGYSLMQSLTEEGLEINEGTLYPLLRRLETQGLLQSKWLVEDGQRPRRYYHLSPAGERVLQALQQNWQELVVVMTHLLSVKSV
ncbi:MAG: PadR family transcriptional regulator [Chloroflexi bacterium]|nr:PadR family transcriptional regulator [Chloroflexota bacterium]MCI0580187.1 PadR family transcriptional regulator [Chloroflexota bacterium]MCI0646045.1 PadR family transcriptional regulator [Chloroflexota bacterium]MCI0727387.1 PadR family transcriptional regulator [Chloroflexota bacterium]